MVVAMGMLGLSIRTFGKQADHLWKLSDVIVAPGGDADATASWDVLRLNQCLISAAGRAAARPYGMADVTCCLITSGVSGASAWPWGSSLPG